MAVSLGVSKVVVPNFVCTPLLRCGVAYEIFFHDNIYKLLLMTITYINSQTFILNLIHYSKCEETYFIS